MRLLNRFPLRWLRRKKAKSLQERFPNHAIGRHSYCDDLVVHDWGQGTTLRIGAFCSLAVGVQIFLGGEHRTDWISTYPFRHAYPTLPPIPGHPASKGDVTVGNDVWIGHQAIILSGVTIGDGAVIGARAVVARDVEPYSIVAGNPARLVRYRFPPDVIAELLKLRWWDWSDEDIRNAVPWLTSGDADSLLAARWGAPQDACQTT